MKSKPVPHIHCVGIGGIGVSALARFYRSQGIRVSGSDLARSEITDALRREGIPVAIGHRPSNLHPSVVRVVHSAAVQPSNPELRAARRRRLPILSYAAVLGELSRQYRTIAVAGTHGKSTSTALVALALTKAGFDPTVVIGTKLKEFGNTNFRNGSHQPSGAPTGKGIRSGAPTGKGIRSWLVIEADEYRASFLNYSPDVAVVTNIDREHLDFYKNIRAIEAAFFKFLLGLHSGGIAVLNKDEARLRRIGRRLARNRPDIRVIWFSLHDPAAIRIRGALRIPGHHNVSNALAAHAACRALKIPSKKILAAIAAYRGAWRRFDYQGQFHGAKVFADYAHHPTEIKATLQAAREKFPYHRIWCVFQPHHDERLRKLFREFSRAFTDCDALVLLDVYEVAGRERMHGSGGANSERLARAVNRSGTRALYLPNPRRLATLLRTWLMPGDVLLMMGAGSIWEMTKNLMKQRGHASQRG